MEVEEKQVVDKHQGFIDAEMTEMNKREESKEAQSGPSPDKKIVGEPTEEKSEEIKAKPEEEVKETEEVEEGKEDQSNLDKRFGKITGENKDLKRDLSLAEEKVLALEERLAKLEEAPSIVEDKISQDKQVEQDRIDKYLSEDVDKPREQQREMSDDDLDDWYLESPREANQWQQDRTLRRADERKADKKAKDTTKQVQEDTKSFTESAKRVAEKHPELDVMDQWQKLESEGKSKEEIYEIITKDNIKYKLATTIVAEMPELGKGPDGPEKIAKEMEKRLKAIKGKVSKEEQDKLDKEAEEEKIAKIKADALADEKARQDSIDEGLVSSQAKQKKMEQTPFYKKQLAVMIKAGGTKEDLDFQLARRKKIPGAGQRDQE